MVNPLLPLAHLDERIRDAEARAAAAGIPLREWNGPMTIRVWERLNEKKERRGPANCRFCNPPTEGEGVR